MVGNWELRAVEVVVPNTKLISMDGGWPRGRRPGDARHPTAA
jgi:hypothetical protein